MNAVVLHTAIVIAKYSEIIIGNQDVFLQRNYWGKINMTPNELRTNISKRIDELFESGRPVLIIFGDKHENHYSICLNRDELEVACLEWVWIKYHDNYYGIIPEPMKPTITQEQIDAMPNCEMKQGALRDWLSYKTELHGHQETTYWGEIINIALQNRDGVMAFAVLEAHNDYQYESFEVKKSEAIKIPPNVNLLKIEPGITYFLE